MLMCPKCRVTYEGNTRFCRACGAALIPARTLPYCPKCEAEYEAGDRFCKSCGGPLSERPALQAPEPSAGAVPPPQAAEPQKARSFGFVKVALLQGFNLLCCFLGVAVMVALENFQLPDSLTQPGDTPPAREFAGAFAGALIAVLGGRLKVPGFVWGHAFSWLIGFTLTLGVLGILFRIGNLSFRHFLLAMCALAAVLTGAQVKRARQFLGLEIS